MLYITSAEEAQISQDVVATTLSAALHEHGSQKVFASQTQISAVFVNNIIKRKRMPSLTMARRLAQEIPLSNTNRSVWIEYVERYWTSRRQFLRAASKLTPDKFGEIVSEISNCRLATFSLDPQVVRTNWDRVLMLGSGLIKQQGIESNVDSYLKMCDDVYEGYAMNGRYVDALWIAKRKQMITSLIEDSYSRYGLSLADYGMQHVNSLRLEMVALNSLGLYRTAYNLGQFIEQDEVFKRNAAFWTSMLTWDILDEMSKIPRTSIREARRLARDAWLHCDRNADDWQPLAHMLVARAFACFCIDYGHLDEAQIVLDRYLPILNQIQFIGAFHRVLFLRTLAKLRWNQKRFDEWRQIIHQAVTIALQAGLQNELIEIQREYVWPVDKFNFESLVAGLSH